MVIILMKSTKMATLGFLKIKVFEIKIVTFESLSREPNYTVNSAM